MGSGDALHQLQLARVASLIENREVSPVEVTELLLKRIESVDQKVKAFITVSGEKAQMAAEAAEKAIAAGYYLGPLHGVPLAIKDIIWTRGDETTAGSKIQRGFVPEEDATVAARLRSAGVIFLGKLNMHEFAYGVTTNNPHYGACRNPWNLERTPGGSSGGSGAAVAARLCYGALGTDTGCSVRLPAAFNGTVGIRPTIGRVSNFRSRGACVDTRHGGAARQNRPGLRPHARGDSRIRRSRSSDGKRPHTRVSGRAESGTGGDKDRPRQGLLGGVVARSVSPRPPLHQHSSSPSSPLVVKNSRLQLAFSDHVLCHHCPVCHPLVGVWSPKDEVAGKPMNDTVVAVVTANALILMVPLLWAALGEALVLFSILFGLVSGALLAYFYEAAGDKPIRAVFGGFHLGFPTTPKENVQKTVDAFRDLDVRTVVPMHCNGLRAHVAFSASMAESYVQPAVGSSFMFGQ